MRVYVASSWRNPLQPHVVRALREAGHVVYDFRHPEPRNEGFHWSAIDPGWGMWSRLEFLNGLKHPIAKRGFELNFQAMRSADAAVLVLPSGRSSHLEAGYFVGAVKPLFILLAGREEPELMYEMATGIHLTIPELVSAIREVTPTEEATCRAPTA